jgi:hypothetical protein
MSLAWMEKPNARNSPANIYFVSIIEPKAEHQVLLGQHRQKP